MMMRHEVTRSQQRYGPTLASLAARALASSHPNRHRQANGQVDEVTVNDKHLKFSFLILNMFKNRIRQIEGTCQDVFEHVQK